MRPIFSTSDSFEAMRSALMEQHTFVVRGAIDPVALAPLAARAAAAYQRWDSSIETAAESDKALFHHGHINANELGAAPLESAVGDGYLGEMVRQVFRWPNRLECPRDFLLRRILPPTVKNENVTPKIAYHQDDYFTMASDPTRPPAQLCFNIWVPLVACGRDAPGLSVVMGSDAPIVMGRPRLGWRPYIIWKYGARALWSPELAVGDVLVFTSRVIHGSYVRRGMTRPRYSLEVRGGIN